MPLTLFVVWLASSIQLDECIQRPVDSFPRILRYFTTETSSIRSISYETRITQSFQCRIDNENGPIWTVSKGDDVSISQAV